MNRKIDEVDPRSQNIERRPEFDPSGLGDHSRNFGCRQRPNCVMNVIHKRIRPANLTAEEYVGERSEHEVESQCSEKET